MNFQTIILVNAARKGFIGAQMPLNPNSIDAKSLTTREGVLALGAQSTQKIPIQELK